MTSAKTAAKQAIAATSSAPPMNDGVRETIESIAIAFILAFLFRTFEAEAFVIPTGSMAPTLMGRHYDLECPQCGFPIRASASEENSDEEQGDAKFGPYLKSCMCANCRTVVDVQRLAESGKATVKSYSGDRIVVSKFPYEFSDPKRWDVAVFRYPATAKTNYIKRIVGLPDEIVRIHSGDVHVKGKGQDHFEVARKPPDKVLAMMQAVYDNDYVLPWLAERGWPVRWQSSTNSSSQWEADPDGKSFSVVNPIGESSWLRYRHYVPSENEWQALEEGPLSTEERAAILSRGPSLVTDFYDYNVRRYDYRQEPYGVHVKPRVFDDDFRGRHWVGDLILEAELQIGDGEGTIILELVEGGRQHHCLINTRTGQAALKIGGVDDFERQAATMVKGPGAYHVRFANVDDQLLLWVNNEQVLFDGETTFGPFEAMVPQRIDEQHDGDWTPAGIGARGVNVRANHLRVLRDVYYIATKNQLGGGNVIMELGSSDEAKLFLGNAAVGDSRRFPSRPAYDFDLGPDNFFALGDNSPKSRDSRLWNHAPIAGEPEYVVNRNLLIGKAMFIYWPHAWAPNWAFEAEFRGYKLDVPFYPNFARMRFVH